MRGGQCWYSNSLVNKTQEKGVVLNQQAADDGVPVSGFDDQFLRETVKRIDTRVSVLCVPLRGAIAFTLYDFSISQTTVICHENATTKRDQKTAPGISSS
jgi:hypothetical protein